jgi:hypothetical protein
MRISRVLKAKTTSISAIEINLFASRRHCGKLRMKKVKKAQHSSLYLDVLLATS